MKAKVFVTLKGGVLDPQGKAVQGSLMRAGHKFVKGVRIGKAIELEIDDMPRDEAIKKIEEICEKLLANTVMENYKIEIAD
jgi:phosphoribosylformylglycinamidine synthase